MVTLLLKTVRHSLVMLISLMTNNKIVNQDLANPISFMSIQIQ